MFIRNTLTVNFVDIVRSDRYVYGNWGLSKIELMFWVQSCE